MAAEKPTLIIGALRDAHILGPRVLQYKLEGEGYHVAFIGAMATQEDFIKSAIETNAAVIMVSSSNGHAELDCQGLRAKCVEAGLGDVILYAGGHISMGGGAEEWQDVEKRFKDMGFDRAYPPGVRPEAVIGDLQSDLERLARSS